MKVKASDYCVFYQALLDKYINDFYAGDISGIDRDTHYVWPLRFNQVKRLKNQTTVENGTVKHDYGNDSIPSVLFGLTDSQGKYFHTKWKDALRNPTIFSISTDTLNKALRYVLDKEPFEMTKLLFKSNSPSKAELEKETEANWRAFLEEFSSEPGKRKKIFGLDLTEEIKIQVNYVIQNYFDLINEEKLMDAWNLLTDNGRRDKRWSGFNDFAKYYNSDMRQSKISDVHVFKLQNAGYEIRALVYFKDRCTVIAPPPPDVAQIYLNTYMTRKPKSGFTDDDMRDLTDYRGGTLTHEDLGIPKIIWDEVFRKRETDTIDKLEEFRITKMFDRYLIDDMIGLKNVNGDINKYKVEKW